MRKSRLDLFHGGMFVSVGPPRSHTAGRDISQALGSVLSWESPVQSSSALAGLGYSFGSDTATSSKILYGFGGVAMGLENVLAELWKNAPFK